jgi:hypothetical protein
MGPDLHGKQFVLTQKGLHPEQQQQLQADSAQKAAADQAAGAICMRVIGCLSPAVLDAQKAVTAVQYAVSPRLAIVHVCCDGSKTYCLCRPCLTVSDVWGGCVPTAAVVLLCWSALCLQGVGMMLVRAAARPCCARTSAQCYMTAQPKPTSAEKQSSSTAAGIPAHGCTHNATAAA